MFEEFRQVGTVDKKVEGMRARAAPCREFVNSTAARSGSRARWAWARRSRLRFLCVKSSKRPLRSPLLRRLGGLLCHRQGLPGGTVNPSLPPRTAVSGQTPPSDDEEAPQ